MSTTIRSSSQLYIDADLDFKAKKGSNLSDGVALTDAVTLGQMSAAIGNAVTTGTKDLHPAVADLAASKAVPASEIQDKTMMLIETLGLYQYDFQSLAVSNDNTVIRPTHIAADAAAGRWLKMSVAMTDHNTMSGLQGGNATERNHLSNAEVAKLGGIEPLADVTDAGNIASAIAGTGFKVSLVDADAFALLNSVGGVLARATWAVIKSTLVTYFNTVYNNYVHPNHTGDVTSAGDGAQTIGANKVTLAHMAQVATDTFLGRDTAGAGNVEVLSVAQVKTILGLTASNQTVRTYRATPTGVVNGSNVSFTIPAFVSGTEEVFKNGQLMNAGAGNDYTVANTTGVITFLTAPSSTPFVDVILVNYSV